MSVFNLLRKNPSGDNTEVPKSEKSIESANSDVTNIRLVNLDPIPAEFEALIPMLKLILSRIYTEKPEKKKACRAFKIFRPFLIWLSQTSPENLTKISKQNNFEITLTLNLIQDLQSREGFGWYRLTPEEKNQRQEILDLQRKNREEKINSFLNTLTEGYKEKEILRIKCVFDAIETSDHEKLNGYKYPYKGNRILLDNNLWPQDPDSKSFREHIIKSKSEMQTVINRIAKKPVGFGSQVFKRVE